MELREEDIELLWRYIDGQCSPEEQLQVSGLLAQDARWKHTYDEIMMFDQTLCNSIETEQPSLRFTKNVMEAITNDAPVHKSYNSKLLIWLFGGVLAVLSAALVVTGLTDIDWSSGKSAFSLAGISLDRNKIVFITLAINTILALVLVDTLLKRKRHTNS